jgi:hypothetical protein
LSGFEGGHDRIKGESASNGLPASDPCVSAIMEDKSLTTNPPSRSKNGEHALRRKRSLNPVFSFVSPAKKSLSQIRIRYFPDAEFRVNIHRLHPF